MNNCKNMEAYTSVQKELLKIKVGISIVGSKIENKEQDQMIRLHIKEGEVLKHPFVFSMSKLTSSIRKINDFGYDLKPVQMKELLQTIHDQYETLPMIRNVYNLGWQLHDGKIVGYQGEMMIDMKGNEVASDPYLDLPMSKGSVNVRLLEKWMKNRIKRQLVFLCQPSAIIAGLLKRNIVFSLCGKSSTGKTTAAKLSQSCFASENYDKTFLNFNGTENGLLKQLVGMRGMGVLIDDTSLSNLNDYTRFIYKLALGSDKARLNSKDFNLINNEKWMTSLILTTETSILDKCDPDKEGALGRLIELKVGDRDLFDDSEECSDMQEYYKNNYGVLAPMIVKYILEKIGVDRIETLYNEELQHIRAQKNSEGVMQRLYESFSIITITAKIINKIFGIEFDIEGMIKELIKMSQKQLEIARSQQTETVIVNEAYYTILSKSNKVGVKVTQDKEKYVFVESSKFRVILKEVHSIFNIDVRDITRVLKDKGLLLSKDGEGKEYSVNKTINGVSKRGFMVSAAVESENSEGMAA